MRKRRRGLIPHGTCYYRYGNRPVIGPRHIRMHDFTNREYEKDVNTMNRAYEKDLRMEGFNVNINITDIIPLHNIYPLPARTKNGSAPAIPLCDFYTTTFIPYSLLSSFSLLIHPFLLQEPYYKSFTALFLITPYYYRINYILFLLLTLFSIQFSLHYSY